MNNTLESKLNHMNFLLEEIRTLREKDKEHGTGNIRTTINTLEERVNEIQVSMLKEEGKKSK